jgi:hypothetical protein
VTQHNPSSLYAFDPQWGSPPAARLDRPVLVVALEGWVDAGMGASAAIAELLTSAPTDVVATFDTEVLIDQRARRPIARLEDGVTTELTWPAIRVVAGKDRVGADILYLTGPEPDFRWPTFIDAVVGLVRDLGVRIVVGLGAFPAPTPHTRPVRLASTVPPQSAELAGRVGTVHGTLEVPAGVQAALEVSLGNAGVPVIGLWARVPHYVSAMPYPEASAALIEGLCAVTGTVLDSSTLRDAGESSRSQVDELIGANPDHLEMVRRLEAALDAEEISPLGIDVEVPSGDEIAAELEQFLRGEGH